MHIYTSSFFKFRNKANFYSFLGASAGTGAPRNTQKIGTQCGCEYGYKNYESFGSLHISCHEGAAIKYEISEKCTKINVQDRKSRSVGPKRRNFRNEERTMYVHIRWQ